MRLGQIFVALVALGVVASCAPPPAAPTASRPTADEPRASAPKRITTAIRGDPRTLNDAINFAAGGSSSAGVREIQQLLHGGLAFVDGRGELRPLFGETVPTLENGLWKMLPDGRMETTWKVKANVEWHDGKPLTADDFVFGATVARDKSLPMSQDAAWPFVESVQTPDRQTLQVTWNALYVDADKLFTQTVNSRNLALPKDLLEAAYTEDKLNFAASPISARNTSALAPTA